MVKYEGWFEIDGNKLDGDYTVSQGDVTDRVKISKAGIAKNSIFVSINSLNSSTAEVKFEILKPDGDPDTEADWIEYHTDTPFEIDEEGVAFPALFESDVRYLRLKFSTLPVDTTVEAFLFRTS